MYIEQVYLQSFSPIFFLARWVVCYIQCSAPSFSNLEVSFVKYIKSIITVLFCFSFPQQVLFFFFFLVCKAITHLTGSAVVDLMKCSINIDEHAAWIILQTSCKHLHSKHCSPSLSIIDILLDFFMFFQLDSSEIVMSL